MDRPQSVELLFHYPPSISYIVISLRQNMATHWYGKNTVNICSHQRAMIDFGSSGAEPIHGFC